MSLNETLTLKQETFVQHLLTGMNTADAGAAIGISKATAFRWIALPHIKAALEQGHTEIHEQIIEDVRDLVAHEFKQMVPTALKAIQASLTCIDAPAVRLKASQLVLDRMTPVTQADQQQQQTLVYDAALMAYMTGEEIATLEQIVRAAEARKLEAEGITPIRKQA